MQTVVVSLEALGQSLSQLLPDLVAADDMQLLQGDVQLLPNVGR